MKILTVKNKDFNESCKQIIGNAATDFITGGYTHVRLDAAVIRVNVVVIDNQPCAVVDAFDFTLKYKTGDRFKAIRNICADFIGNPRLYTKDKIYSIKCDEYGNYLTRSDEGEMTYISEFMLDNDFTLIKNSKDNFDHALSII